MISCNKQINNTLTQAKGCCKILWWKGGGRLNQKQMEYFIEVYRQGNMQGAADRLYVSRQGVSKMIKTLEEELGQLLFIRNPHGLVPTDYATALLPHVQRLLEEYRSIAGMSTLASQSKSVVTVYAWITFWRTLVPNFSGIFISSAQTCSLAPWIQRMTQP